MFTQRLVALFAALGVAAASPVQTVQKRQFAANCTTADRIAYSMGIPYAYASNPITVTEADFAALPFGVPDLAGPCPAFIYPNGGGPIPVAITGQDVVNFGVATRQVFSSVTGDYEAFDNGTTVIYTNVTLGVNSVVPVPVTFSGQVYLDFDEVCRMTAVRAYAEVPTYIDGQPVTIYELLPIPTLPVKE